MTQLSRENRRSRLALDYRAFARAKPCDAVSVTAHTSLEALEKGRPAAPDQGEAGLAEFYCAQFKFPILTGAGTTTKTPVVAVFDASHVGYPYASPGARILSRPLPWSPHVHVTGSLCIGPMWRDSNGRLLLIQLVAHCARFLNCDEPDPGAGYNGWNAAAIEYWRTTMNRQPLNPGLVYPTLPLEVTHGVLGPTGDDTFLPANAGDDFVPLGTAS